MTLKAKAVLAGALLSGSICPPANADDPTSLNQQVERARAQNYSVFATFPIYNQILAISFPRGFVPVTQTTRGPSYLQESVQSGETAEQWTQMLSILGTQGAGLNPTVTVERAKDFYVNRYRGSCPDTLAMIDLGDGGLAGHDARVVVVSCGSVPSASGSHSESMLLIVLKGTQDFYSIQWATRGPASSVPLQLDRNEWTTRLRRLQPVKLCARVPGETAPYPSCIGKR